LCGKKKDFGSRGEGPCPDGRKGGGGEKNVMTRWKKIIFHFEKKNREIGERKGMLDTKEKKSVSLRREGRPPLPSQSGISSRKAKKEDRQKKQEKHSWARKKKKSSQKKEKRDRKKSQQQKGIFRGVGFSKVFGEREDGIK